MRSRKEALAIVIRSLWFWRWIALGWLGFILAAVSVTAVAYVFADTVVGPRSSYWGFAFVAGLVFCYMAVIVAAYSWATYRRARRG